MKSCKWQAMHLQLLGEVRLLFADASPCAEWNRSKVSHRVFETDLLLTTSLSGYTCETFWVVLIYCNAVKECNACSISPIFTLKIINHLTEHLLSSFITVTVLFLKTYCLTLTLKKGYIIIPASCFMRSGPTVGWFIGFILQAD